MNKLSRTLKIISICILVAAIALGIYLYFVRPNQVIAIDSRPLSYVYLWNNPSFTNAEKLTLEGKYEEALDEYNKLLQSDLSKEDVISKSQINIRVATLLDLAGEKGQAVIALNQIATNDKEYFITRSFAYEYMARMLFDTRSESILLSITSTTGIQAVGVDPYQSVAKQLLQKSEVITPLYLGLTQAMKVDLLSTAVTLTPENTKAYRYDLGVADRMIADIRAEQNKGYMLPLALLRKAQIAERIEASGNYGLPQTVEQYYIDAQVAYDTYPEARSYNYVYYEFARYLALKYGQAKKPEIGTLLAHFDKEVAEKSNLKLLLTQVEQKKGSQVQNKEHSVLKSIAPAFKL